MTEQDLKDIAEFGRLNSDKFKKDIEDRHFEFEYDQQKIIDSQFEKYGSIPRGYL